MDKGIGREGRGVGRHTAGTSHIEPHAQALIRSPPADARDPGQLPQSVAGALIDPDDSHFLGAGTGSGGKLGVGAVGDRRQDVVALVSGTDVQLALRGGTVSCSQYHLRRLDWPMSLP